MPDIRAGGYVDSVPAKGARESLHVVIQGKAGLVLVSPRMGGSTPVMGGLGFANDDVALNAKRGFTQELQKLSLALGKQIEKDKTKIGDPGDPQYEQQMVQKLSLTAAKSDLTLDALRNVGFGLRDQLNPEVFAAFKKSGLMQRLPAEEPAMTFDNYDQVPVLWDMMYDQKVAGEDTEWEHFWGFRVPITHWQMKPTNQFKIRLKRGLFSAIDETLLFANNEVSLLAQKLTGGLCHRSLCDEFKKLALNELRTRGSGNADVEAWFEAQSAKSWFRSFIDKLNEDLEDPDEIKLQTGRWKSKTLNAIFSDPEFTYELIHFACHCEPDKLSELLTQLKINIAGEEVALTVAQMSGSREGLSDQDGPLVFLNACGTGGQGNNAEPPGFPENWINKRGALAVVATLCPVPDLFAHAFAWKFYNTLFQSVEKPEEPVRERYLSEALLETRRYFMTKCRNPLGLAYVLYAVRDACIEPRI